MYNSIFDFTSYKAYLKWMGRTNPSFGHGFRSRIAKALNCQTAYISQVLNKDANFSLEQAEELNQLLQHSKDESRFFRLLVQLERAGTSKLRKAYQDERTEILERRELLKERVEKTDSLSVEQQSRYYSRWYFAAIHILCTIPEFQTKELIIEKLRLSLSTVNEALEFLVGAGLLILENGKYSTSKLRLFIGKDSAMISQLHSNWRLKAIESLDKKGDRDLHYSTCISLSNSDFSKIKNNLIEQINEIGTIVKDSKEEDLCSVSIDFYSLIKYD